MQPAPQTPRPILHLHRIGTRPDVAPTTGRLIVYGVQGGPALRLVTLEPPWRQNARRVSCIPPGLYQVAPHTSPRFGRCLDVLGEEPRSHVLFHAGNSVADTAGCILPGSGWGPDDSRGRKTVQGSRWAMSRLLQEITGRAWLVITADTNHA